MKLFTEWLCVVSMPVFIEEEASIEYLTPWCVCIVELDEDDMALMAEASGDDVKAKVETVKKDSKKDEEPLPDYDAVVAADVEGQSLDAP